MKKKNLMRLSVGVAGAVFGLLPVTGHAKQTTTLPNGAPLSVQLDSPSNCEEFKVPMELGAGIPVEGKASVGEGEGADTGLIVVVDVSGSTSTADSCGNGSTILDCEKDGVLGMFDPSVSKAIKEFGLVVFGSDAETADMTDDTGDQLFTESSDDATTVADSIHPKGVSLFTAKSESGNTNYSAGLGKAAEIANKMTSKNKLVVFLSDGASNRGGDKFDGNLKALKNVQGVNAIYPFAIGKDGCSAGSAGTLDDIAYGTGIACKKEDPNNLKAILPALIKTSLDSVDVSIGSNPLASTKTPSVPADGPMTTAYNATADSLVPGTYNICAKATGSDNNGSASVSECANIQLLQLTASPETAENEINNENSHTVKAEIVGGDGCSPEPRDINFVVSGQNSANGSVSALPNNEVQFTYTVPKSCDSLGTDTITVSTDIGGETASVALQKTWVDNTPPVATCESVNGTLQVNADDLCGVTLTVTDADGHVYPGIQPGDTIQYGQYQTSRMPHKQVKMNGWPADWVLVGHGNLTVTAVDASGNESSAVCPGTDRYSVRR